MKTHAGGRGCSLPTLPGLQQERRAVVYLRCRFVPAQGGAPSVFAESLMASEVRWASRMASGEPRVLGPLGEGGRWSQQLGWLCTGWLCQWPRWQEVTVEKARRRGLLPCGHSVVLPGHSAWSLDRRAGLGTQAHCSRWTRQQGRPLWASGLQEGSGPSGNRGGLPRDARAQET